MRRPASARDRTASAEQRRRDADRSLPARRSSVDRDQHLDATRSGPPLEPVKSRSSGVLPARSATSRRLRAVAKHVVDGRAKRCEPQTSGDDEEVASARRSSGHPWPYGPRSPRTPSFGGLDGTGDGPDGTDRVHQLGGLIGIAADRDRDLADPEHVHHVELPGEETARLSV